MTVEINLRLHRPTDPAHPHYQMVNAIKHIRAAWGMSLLLAKQTMDKARDDHSGVDVRMTDAQFGRFVAMPTEDDELSVVSHNHLQKVRWTEDDSGRTSTVTYLTYCVTDYERTAQPDGVIDIRHNEASNP